jgi:DNA modification methylase
MILLGDAAIVLKDFVDGCISLTVTSPPYDNLRTYGNLTFCIDDFYFKGIADELYRVTKEGGILVWVVGDATVKGTETLTSFKQAIYFTDIGFKLHDTMIYQKANFAKPSFNRYHQTFEYMFILCKNHINTFNAINDRKINWAGQSRRVNHYTESNGISKRVKNRTVSRYGMRHNIWIYNNSGNLVGSEDRITSEHPATFPEQLAEDHIKSWSNEGDLILDPFAGSGTTLKAAQQLNRRWVGIEINPEYVQLAKKRLTPYVQQQRLTSFPLETPQL